VGFVQDLPHQLVSAFSATLEETALADVLLHIVDAHDTEHERKIQDVNAVLAEIKADKIPQIIVYNKIDLLPEAEQHAGSLKNHAGQTVAVRVSAASGTGLADFARRLAGMGITGRGCWMRAARVNCASPFQSARCLRSQGSLKTQTLSQPPTE